MQEADNNLQSTPDIQQAACDILDTTEPCRSLLQHQAAAKIIIDETYAINLRDRYVLQRASELSLLILHRAGILLGAQRADQEFSVAPRVMLSQIWEHAKFAFKLPFSSRLARKGEYETPSPLEIYERLTRQFARGISITRLPEEIQALIDIDPKDLTREKLDEELRKLPVGQHTANITQTAEDYGRPRRVGRLDEPHPIGIVAAFGAGTILAAATALVSILGVPLGRLAVKAGLKARLHRAESRSTRLIYREAMDGVNDEALNRAIPGPINRVLEEAQTILLEMSEPSGMPQNLLEPLHEAYQQGVRGVEYDFEDNPNTTLEAAYLAGALDAAVAMEHHRIRGNRQSLEQALLQSPAARLNRLIKAATNEEDLEAFVEELAEDASNLRPKLGLLHRLTHRKIPQELRETIQIKLTNQMNLFREV